MNNSNSSENPPGWGIHINHKKDMGYPPHPQWVLASNLLAWQNIGVVIWDEYTSNVMCLFPQQALDVLDDLRESSEWKSTSFCLGWNSYTMPFSEEDRVEWRTTKNRRSRSKDSGANSCELLLTPRQAQDLILYLARHEKEIRELAEAYTKDVRKTLGRVYSLILSWGRKREHKEQKSP
jgi:hypothetical protein